MDEPGQMKVTLTDGNGCVFTDTIQVDSINPIADFTPVSDQFEGPGEYEGTELMEVEFINESVNFAKASYALSDTTFKWNLYANQTPGGEDNWFFSYDYDEKIDTNYTGEATYLVCLVAKNFNDCRDTICKPITVHAIVDIAQPNVFTPDNGPNQQFYFSINGIDEFDCRVFNRYGVEVFRFTSVNDAWDGNNFRNGKPCADGVYFYSYTAVSTNGASFEGQGNIHLIRAE